MPTLPLRYQVEGIASGHNNIFTVPFFQLSRPLFAGYKSQSSYDTQWNPQESLVLASDRQTEFKIGRPFIRFTFPVLTLEEIAYLRALGPLVSIYVHNEETLAWGFYNGTLRVTPKPDKRNPDEKEGKVVDVIDLIEFP